MKINIKLLSLSFSLLTLLLLSCSNPTSSEKGNLTGTINLEGQTDHSGIVIGVYELTGLDPDIVEANQKWPHIGVIINQHTEFDHRFGTLVKTGETDASGYFKITGIQTGIYNIVVIKDGFGFHYVYEVNIGEGDNSLTDSKSDIILYSETVINSDITMPVVWHTDHHYIIEQDIIVDDELMIEPGAVIRLNQGKEITSYGTINTVGEQEDLIWFTKNDGFSDNLGTVNPDSNYMWNRITLESYSEAHVQWCKFDWANIGLLNHISGFEISDCIFKESLCGFKAEDVDSVVCWNIFGRDIKNTQEATISLVKINHASIHRCIAISGSCGLVLKDHSDGDVYNNYFCGLQNGIDVSYSSTPYIHNNEINGCEYSIAISYYSIPNIEKNSSRSNYGISFVRINEQIEVHNNNLNDEIYSLYNGPDTACHADINATSNYYYLTSAIDIEDKIFDKTDVSQSQQQYCGIVLFDPFLNTENNQAGIQEE